MLPEELKTAERMLPYLLRPAAANTQTPTRDGARIEILYTDTHTCGTLRTRCLYLPLLVDQLIQQVRPRTPFRMLVKWSGLFYENT